MFISCSPAEKKRALFFEFRTIIPLENHCFGDRPFLPFEVGRARAIALISLAWLTLTTWFGIGSAVDDPIFALLNQLANVNGLKGQLINLASALTTNRAQHTSLNRPPGSKHRRAEWIKFIFDGNVPATVGTNLYVCVNHFVFFPTWFSTTLDWQRNFS